MAKILLLEDDRDLGETIVELLEDAGYEVVWVTNGEEAADESYEGKFDLYLLDINVPEMDGLELLKSLRDAEDETPAIYISAMTDIKTIAKGFDLGAEDFIKKPFEAQELLIRLRARLTKERKAIRCGDIEYDPVSKTVRKNGEILSLGEVQTALLALFLRRRGQVIDRETLMECLEHPGPSALRVAISGLKEKTGLPVKNVRGVGYALESC